MNANEMTFGVEIECVIPREHANLVPIGSYHAGYQIPSLPRGWNAQSDGSLEAPRGHFAVEIVSPILKGSDGVAQLKVVCEFLARVNAKVNRSTGFHVHIGWSGDEDALKRLAHDVANFEPALFAATGTHSREVPPGGRTNYCKGIRDSQQYRSKFVQGSPNAQVTSRYHTLNITNLTQGRNTVEFRCFAGTTNLTKILGYVRLCLGIVERAVNMKKPSKWTGVKVDTTRPTYRGMGKGEVELNRLFFALGWRKGDTKIVHGNVNAEGVPSIDDCKLELTRLAKKYDGSNRYSEASASVSAVVAEGVPVVAAPTTSRQPLVPGQMVTIAFPSGGREEAEIVRAYSTTATVIRTGSERGTFVIERNWIVGQS